MVSQRRETDFFSGEPLRALSTLVYSDNVSLQRSASLTFAEVTERGKSTPHLGSGSQELTLIFAQMFASWAEIHLSRFCSFYRVLI